MSLTQETLERLLLDQALGALDPDVEALLEAHLERDAGLRRLASEFGATAALARRAIESAELRAGESLPELAPGPAPQRRFRPWAVAAKAAALAACLAAGLLLGAVLFRGAGGQVRHEWLLVPPRTSAESAASQFWSGQRLYEQAKSAPRGQPAGVKWSWPFRVEPLGDQS